MHGDDSVDSCLPPQNISEGATPNTRISPEHALTQKSNRILPITQFLMLDTRARVLHL